jgi:hypothetical protein
MPRPPEDAPVLARWTVDPAAWRAFVHAVRTHAQHPRAAPSHFELADAATEAERTVIVAGDAIHVGTQRVDLDRAFVTELVEHPDWLQFGAADGDFESWMYPVPVPPREAAHVLGHLRARVAVHAAELARITREAEEERRRPTPSNRLLWFVERHFIVLLLVLFFVVLPGIAVLVAWLAGDASLS